MGPKSDTDREGLRSTAFTMHGHASFAFFVSFFFFFRAMIVTADGLLLFAEDGGLMSPHSDFGRGKPDK